MKTDARRQTPDASRKIKRSFLFACFACFVVKLFALDPATLSIVSVREESVANASEADFYSGAPLLLTNCIAYFGTSTNSARQNLTNLTVIVKLGTTTNNVVYTGTVANATSGTWWARIAAVPTNWDSPKLFLQLTNVTDKFGYPFKILKVKTPL